MKSPKKLAIVIPSMVMGGMERVASEIANYIAAEKECKVFVVTLVDESIFYTLHPSVQVITPKVGASNRIKSFFSTLIFLRRTISFHKPDAILSFGSKFNSFTLLACRGLKVPVYVSDRSNPYRNSTFNIIKRRGVKNDHWIHAILKRVLYPASKGIIAQTELAKKIDSDFVKHKNIRVIGNPIRQIESPLVQRENIILNVGRFQKLKNQSFLLKAFHKVANSSWELYFAGDGPFLEEVREKAIKLGIEDKVRFLGKVKDIDPLYRKSKIFAFTSLSEGFPNALAEALYTPVASISFNCVAGPSDLIENGHNGFLINENDEAGYVAALKKLMEDEDLRLKFEKNALNFMKKYDSRAIGEKYYQFMFEHE